MAKMRIIFSLRVSVVPHCFLFLSSRFFFFFDNINKNIKWIYSWISCFYMTFITIIYDVQTISKISSITFGIAAAAVVDATIENNKHFIFSFIHHYLT